MELCKGETDIVSQMAAVFCEKHNSDGRFDWTRFYRVTEPDALKIVPYQGGHGRLSILLDRSICGKVASTGKPCIINYVNSAKNHIACS